MEPLSLYYVMLKPVIFGLGGVEINKPGIYKKWAKQQWCS